MAMLVHQRVTHHSLPMDPVLLVVPQLWRCRLQGPALASHRRQDDRAVLAPLRRGVLQGITWRRSRGLPVLA